MTLKAILLSAVAVAMSSPAWAIKAMPVTISDPTFYAAELADGPGGGSNLPPATSVGPLDTTFDIAGAQGVANVLGLSAPLVTISDSVSPSSTLYDIQSYASLTYYVAAIGPENTLVPVRVQSLLTVSGGSVANQVESAASAQLIVDNISVIDCTTGVTEGGVPCTATGKNLSVDQYIDLLSDTPTPVYMTALGVAATGYGSVGASVDPYFSIDPSFLGQNPGFSLQFSAGIGNALPNGIPEPATWASMLLGLGGVGAMLRRGRRARCTAFLKVS